MSSSREYEFQESTYVVLYTESYICATFEVDLSTRSSVKVIFSCALSYVGYVLEKKFNPRTS